MGLGVLEPTTRGPVPGTVLLDDAVAEHGLETQQLKHGNGRNTHIILVPQPSDDPDDPLNWSSFERHVIWAILCLGAVVNGATPGAMLISGVAPISRDLGISFAEVAKLAGYVLLAAGSSGPFVSALSRKYGKRPIFIFASTMALLGCILGEVATNYNSLIAARVIEGFGCGTYESLVMAAIGDIFFVHERGPRIAVVIFILAASGNLVLVIAGAITNHLGWRYNFHVLLPFTALQWLLLIFFVPETTYLRERAFNIDTVGATESEDLRKAATEALHSETVRLEKTATSSNPITESTDLLQYRKPFWNRLAIYNGIFVHDSIFKMLLASPVILFNVGASYNVFVSGLAMAWYVALAVVGTVIFSLPPYSYSATAVGYVCIGPLIGGILGTAFAIVLSRPVTFYMVRRNNGIYEPEFRLVLIAVGFVTAVAGIFGFGYSIKDAVSVYIISFNWAIALFGINIIVILSSAYVLDAFRDYSTEIFVMNMVFKNFFNYGLTNYIVDWYMLQGASKLCNVLAGITIAVVLTTVPMYMFGKRYRAFWKRHNLIRKWRLETDKTGAE